MGPMCSGSSQGEILMINFVIFFIAFNSKGISDLTKLIPGGLTLISPSATSTTLVGNDYIS